MNQENRVAGELMGPIATTSTVVETIGGDGMRPIPATYSLGVGSAPTGTSSGAAVNPLALLKALKRRLALALGLGIVVSSACSAAAWFLLPPPNYQAVAKVLVRPNTPQIMWKTVDAEAERDESVRNQKTQILQLKSRFVINNALQQKGISELKMIRDVELKQVKVDEWLIENLQAQFLAGTEVLQISLEGKDPQELAKLVNAITTTYIEEVANGDQKKRTQRLSVLKKLSDEKFTELKNRKAAARQLFQKAGSDDRSTLVLKQQYAIEQGADVRRELRVVQSKKRELEATIKVRRPEALQETAAPAVSNEEVARLIERDPEVVSLKAKLTNVSQKLASESEYTRRVARKSGLNPALKTLHDEVELLTRQLDRRRKAIRSSVIQQLQNPNQDDGQPATGGGSLEQQLAVLNELEANLQEELKNAAKSDQALTDNTLDVQDNKEDLKQLEDVANKIAGEVERLDVELKAPPRITLLEDAIPPTTRNVKKWYTTFGGVAVGSLLGTLFLIAFLEMQTRKIDSANEVVQDLGLPVVGSLPMLPTRARRKGLIERTEKDRHWYSLLLESIDATRTMLIHAARSGSHRVFMISSALPGEGKTSLASHLATSLARSGQKTLLVDADLRCPSIHRLFDLSPEPGLSELLRGEITLDNVVVCTAVDELKVITAGKCDGQTLRVLSQGGMGGLFAQLKEQFDFVIVDSSPILPVADAQIIAQQVDAVVFSVLADVSRKAKIQAAYQRIASLGVKVIGAVVTGAHDLGGYGNKYYSGYVGSVHSSPSALKQPTTNDEVAS